MRSPLSRIPRNIQSTPLDPHGVATMDHEVLTPLDVARPIPAFVTSRAPNPILAQRERPHDVRPDDHSSGAFSPSRNAVRPPGSDGLESTARCLLGEPGSRDALLRH